jgi:molybdenum cofactor synthesis domain-containing protein
VAVSTGIIVVGTEILQGFTLDTNTNWLAKKLTALGWMIRKVITIQDSKEEIIRSVSDLLEDGYECIFICGGLGSTPDDVTVQAVASAIGKELHEDPVVKEWLRARIPRWYERGAIPEPKMTDGIRKMTLLPEGSIPLKNDRGAAPGIFTEVINERVDGSGKTKIFVLPGVPRELKHLFEERIAGVYLDEKEDRPYFKEIIVKHTEAQMHDMLKMLDHEHKNVTVGSYPQDDHSVVLRIYGRSESEVSAMIVRIKEILDLK